MQQTPTYKERSRTFLVKAREEIASGDLEQASEKAWASAALMVKDWADQRGILHEKHSHLFNVVHDLARQTNDQQLRRLFHVASNLHGNFYENTFDPQAVNEGIDDVEMLMERMENLL